MWNGIIDQELISYRCSSCCCSCWVLRWPLQKEAEDSFVSDQTRMKFGWSVLHINMHRLTVGFLMDVIFQNGGHDISHSSCHLVNENRGSPAWISSSARQFLIYSTFVLVILWQTEALCNRRLKPPSCCHSYFTMPSHKKNYKYSLYKLLCTRFAAALLNSSHFDKHLFRYALAFSEFYTFTIWFNTVTMRCMQ